MGSEALLVLDAPPGAENSGWDVPPQLQFPGPSQVMPDEQIRFPPDSAQAPNNYLEWGMLDPLYLCSGKATVLTVSGAQDWAAQTQSEAILKLAGAQRLRPGCVESATMPNTGRGNASRVTGYRVRADAVAEVKSRLSALGKVTTQEALVEAVDNPGRREAHRWYASLSAEMKEAGLLLRDTPHIKALVQDELRRLPRYFASSDDPERRVMLYIVTSGEAPGPPVMAPQTLH
jgi:hypothetical protein